MNPLAYSALLLLPPMALLGLWLGGAWTFLLPAVVFGLVPTAELFLTGSKQNAPDEDSRRASRAYDALLFAVIPFQLLTVFALAALGPALSPLGQLGAVMAVAICCGGLGINVAHELGHRSETAHKRAASLLLLTSLYQHFLIEHNRGHHARVATPHDPASAARGESLYAFIPRSVIGGVRSAWDLEVKRLQRKGRVWTWDNHMLRYAVYQPLFVLALALLTSPHGALLFVCAAIGGFALLETVNYVEHYGLRRDELADGRYERVRPAHSWTSDHPLSRVLLFDLTRHADHHANPGRPYQVLRHFDDAPELPTGYAGMILLATVPPLFKAVMERHLEKEARRLSALAA